MPADGEFMHSGTAIGLQNCKVTGGGLQSPRAHSTANCEFASLRVCGLVECLGHGRMEPRWSQHPSLETRELQMLESYSLRSKFQVR